MNQADKAFAANQAAQAARAGSSGPAVRTEAARANAVPRRELHEMEAHLGQLFRQELLGRSGQRPAGPRPDTGLEAALDAGGYGVMRIQDQADVTIEEDLDQLQRLLRVILARVGAPRSGRRIRLHVA